MRNHTNVIFYIIIVQLLLSPDGCLSCGCVCNVVILCSWLLGEHKFCEYELCSRKLRAWKADGTWNSYIMQQKFSVFPDVVEHRQNCADFLSHWTFKENRTLHVIKTNLSQSHVTNSSLLWHILPFSFLFFQTELKLWSMENQPMAVQLAAVFEVIWYTVHTVTWPVK